MPVWSQVALSALAPGSRIDPEFYRPEFLARERELTHLPCSPLGNLAFVTDGEHGSVPYTETGVRYLTAENIQPGFVELSNIRYVDDWVNRRNARAIVCPGDVLISIKGTLGLVAVAEEWLPPANMNRDVAILKIRSHGLKSEFLAAFLLSRFGQFQALREGSGGVQQMITLGRLRTIHVPVLQVDAQESVASLWRQSTTKRQLSISLSIAPLRGFWRRNWDSTRSTSLTASAMKRASPKPSRLAGGMLNTIDQSIRHLSRQSAGLPVIAF
jgi:hypothetical protein